MPARHDRSAGLRFDLTTDPIVDPSLTTELHERIASWTAAAKPTDAIQGWLVARAAAASVRLDRAAAREQAIAADAVRSASADWQRKRRARVRKAAQKLADDPTGTLDLLESSAFGCDWLIAKWENLACDLRHDGWISPEEFALIQRMLGRDPARLHKDEPFLGPLWRAMLAIAPKLDEADAERALGCAAETRPLPYEARLAALRQRLPEPQAARQQLLDVAEDQLDWLHDRRAQLWEEVELPQRAEAIGAARCPAGPALAELRRYEASHAAELHRCLGQLARAQAVAAKAEAGAPEPPARCATEPRVEPEPCDGNPDLPETCTDSVKMEGRAPGRTEAVGSAAPGRPVGVPGGPVVRADGPGTAVSGPSGADRDIFQTNNSR